MDYGLNDIVEMKKQHPCRKSKYWQIIRMGAIYFQKEDDNDASKYK